jgi:hypothetical protein
MLRHFGMRALAAGAFLATAASLRADEPVATGQLERITTVAPGVINADSELPMGTRPATIIHKAAFDPYAQYHENMSAQDHGTWRQRWYGKKGCDTCGTGMGLLGGLGRGGAGGCGPNGCGTGGPPGYLAGPDGNACDFTCANCWNRFDVEKRFFVAYVHDDPYAYATRAGYGDAHGIQLGVEVLPWVISDGANFYSRWGVTSAFAWYNYTGNLTQTLRSNETGNLLTIRDGETFSGILAFTYRADFDIAGVRMSPNASLGMSFDWTNVDRTEPRSLVNVRRIDKFKYSGFDAAGYVKLMWDFGLTDNLNFGVGGQFRFAPTDVMTDDGELRKHIGLVLQLSHQF